MGTQSTGGPHTDTQVSATVKAGRLGRKLRSKMGQWRNLKKRGHEAAWTRLIQGAIAPGTKHLHFTAAAAG